MARRRGAIVRWPRLTGEGFHAGGEALQRALWWVEERPLALLGVAFVVALGVAVAMALVAGPHAVKRSLRHVHPLWFVVLLAGQLVSYASYTLAHRFALLADGREQLSHGTAFRMAAYGAAATSLRGGFSIDRRALRGAGASRRRANVRVLGLGALEYAVLAPVTWVCALTLLDNRHVQAAVTVPWALGVPLGAIAAGLLARQVRSRDRRPRRGVARMLDEAIAALELVVAQFRHPLRHAPSWAAMAMHWTGEIVSLWAALRAFGVHASVAVLVLGYATGYALTPRSLPLAGAGVTEALLPISLLWVGISLAPAVLAVIAYRFARLLLSMPPALAARERVQQLLRRHWEAQT